MEYVAVEEAVTCGQAAPSGNRYALQCGKQVRIGLVGALRYLVFLPERGIANIHSIAHSYTTINLVAANFAELVPINETESRNDRGPIRRIGTG